ncbi:MAG TPA: lytic murein transglycosylase B [Burkholderiaceae bacterium]|nr:lytic murein transglycosylase B [Burkholderiaceae bacterium]
MKRRSLLAAMVAALLPPALVRAQSASYLLRDDVLAFIDALVDGYGFDRGWVLAALGQARYNETAERLTTPGLQPPSARNWREYRARALDESRIRDGLAFWQAQRATLARATETFGVPAEIVVAIIGIETRYGRHSGSHRVIDVLMTLTFDYTRRAGYYREELAQFLLLCREQGLDPLAQHGSFAGALGLPQFMPSSVRAHAIDFDGDGRIDIANSVADAIGSVAHFLATYGWTRDLAVALSAQASAEVSEVLGQTIFALYRWQDLERLGVTIDGALDPDTRVLLADLPFVSADGVEGVEYRVGTVNYSALLHYNRSFSYATAVAELARELRDRSHA